MAGTLKVKRLSVDPAGWTDVYPPAKCENVLISNLAGSGVLRLRIDKSDPSTEIPIDVGSERMISAPAFYVEGGTVDRPRFVPSELAFSLKPDSGVGPITLVWA